MNIAPPAGTIQIVRLPDRGLVGLGGIDAREFLQNLVSNDVRRLAPDCTIYALLLTPQGKFLYDFFVVEIAHKEAGTQLLLDCERDRVDDLISRLTLYRLRANVVIENLSDHFEVRAAFGGPAAIEIGLNAAPGSTRFEAGGAVFVDPRLADLGIRAILPLGQSLKITSAQTAAVDDYELHRLRLGVPDGSHDLDVNRTFPLEAGLEDLHAIDYGKGCYVGQELTARTHYRGTVRKRLFPVTVDGPLPEYGTAVLLGDQRAGDVRSGRDGQALAMLRFEHVEEAERTGAVLTAGSATLTPHRRHWMRLDPREKAGTQRSK